jgi:hypothetical protein
LHIWKDYLSIQQRAKSPTPNHAFYHLIMGYVPYKMPRAINPNHSNNIREKNILKKKKTTITWCMPKAICWSLLRTKHSILYTMYDTIDVNTLFFKQTIDAHHDLKQCLLYACVAMFMKRRISHMLNHVGNLQTSSPLTSSMHDRESINDCTKYCTLKYFCD